MRRHIGESRVAVPADARATEEVNAGVKFVVEERHAGVPADSASSDALVVSQRTRARRAVDGARRVSARSCTREDPCMECAHKTEDFVVTPPWIGGHFKYEVGGAVERIVGLIVKESG